MNQGVTYSALLLLVVCVCVASGCINPAVNDTAELLDENLYLLKAQEAPPEVMTALDHFSSTVSNQGNALDVELSQAADVLSGINPTNTVGISDVLMELYTNHTYSVGVSRVGPSGEEYATLPIHSMSGLELTLEFWEFNETAFATHDATILMGPLYSKDYGEIIHFRHPVYTSDGTYDGWVGMSLTSSSLVDPLQDYFAYTNATNYFPALYSAEGTILYYPTQEIIGDNIHTLAREDSEVLKHTNAIFTMPDGVMKYMYTPFNPGPLVEYTTVWETITVCGRELKPNIIMYEVEDWNENFSDNFAIEDLSDLVFGMYQYGKANGIEATTAEIQNPHGTFSKNPNIVLFAYDMNATALAHSQTPDRIGKNQMNAGDAYALRYISRMVDLCTQGGGFVHYYKPVGEPSGSLSVLMISYVLPVQQEWFVGASYPLVFSSPDPKKRDNLADLVVAAQQYVRDHGKDAALQEFSTQNSTFQSPWISLMTMDYNGTVLSAPADLGFLGEDAFGFTNAHGVSSMREIVILSKHGGGYLLMDIRGENSLNIMHLLYTEPVDEEWCIVGWTELNSFVERSTSD